jgi:hypothetical protein
LVVGLDACRGTRRGVALNEEGFVAARFGSAADLAAAWPEVVAIGVE